MTYNIGGIWFSSKEKVRKYAAEIRDKYVQEDVITDPDETKFLTALISRHVNAKSKIGAGIKHFMVDTAPGGFSTCFWIERIDGTKTDFGVPSCLEDIGRINRRSLRSAVRDHIKQFAAKNLSGDFFVSAFSGKSFPREEAHVDHIIPFETIVREFFKSQKFDLENELLTESVDGCETPVWKNPDLIASFIEYHNRHPLRMVHMRENMSDIRKAG